MEGGRREGTRVSLRLILADVWQKTTKFCKATILQLKNLKKKRCSPLSINYLEIHCLVFQVFGKFLISMLSISHMMPNYVSHKILSVFKIHEEANNKRQTSQFKNGQKTWVDRFLKTYKWLTEHVKQCSTSLTVREITRATGRHPLHAN